MRRVIQYLTVFTVLSVLLTVVSCGGGSGDSTPLMWTWMSGSDTPDQVAVYSPSVFAIPGGRYGSVSWMDNAGNLWLFGGYVRHGSLGYNYHFNDLWRFDGTYWTWMSGSDGAFASASYGTMGIPHASNVPGPRVNAISWTDSSGNFWLFGGSGVGGGDFNDLWKFDGTYWTWMSGSNTVQQLGVYGTLGVPDASNMPGGRSYSVSWIDSADNLWLFGGLGPDGTGLSIRLNDLWKFDGTDWTWMSGSNAFDQICFYGTKGSPGASNAPGGRVGSVSWIDSADNLWLFGGSGHAGTTANRNSLNDLWKFDGTDWTWISGGDTVTNPGIYGTLGVPNASNVPGARTGSVSWIDSADNLWLFGGSGRDGSGLSGRLNDLWRFDGTNWTWMSGSDTVASPGVYGTMGSPAASNVPGARTYSVSWIDSAGNFWLFGGVGYDGTLTEFNDLWKYVPQ